MATYRVFVGGLNDRITKTDLEDAFSRYGRLASCWIARSPPGFGFIEYYSQRDAEDAVKDLDDREFKGSRIRVEIARGGHPPSRRDRDRDRDRNREYDRYESSSSRRYDDSRHSSRRSRSRSPRRSSRFDDRRDRLDDRSRRGKGRYDDLPPKCFNCNQFGHLAFRCPKKPNQGECYSCGEMGHQQRNCPKLVGNNPNGRDNRRSSPIKSPHERRERSRSPYNDRERSRSRTPQRESQRAFDEERRNENVVDSMPACDPNPPSNSMGAAGSMQAAADGM